MSEEIRQHNHWTDKGQDYTCFRIHCETCGMPLYEFVHKQIYGSGRYGSGDKILAQPTEGRYAEAQSWCKPLFAVVCPKVEKVLRNHVIVPVLPRENSNQVVKSRSMTAAEFIEWSKENASE